LHVSYTRPYDGIPGNLENIARTNGLNNEKGSFDHFVHLKRINLQELDAVINKNSSNFK